MLYRARARDRHRYGWRAMALGVLEQIADHAAEKPRIARHADSLAIERAVVIARAFLRRERQQIDLFGRLQRWHRIKAAGQQDFLDQPFELADVALEIGLVFC